MRDSQGLNLSTPTDIPLEKLYNEKDLSRITGRSVASIRRDRMFRQGCPFVKLHHQVRYRPADVRQYLERNLCGAVTPREAA